MSTKPVMNYLQNATVKQIRTFSGHGDTGCVQLLDYRNTQALHSRLLAWLMQRQENQMCGNRHVAQSVDKWRPITSDCDR